MSTAHREQRPPPRRAFLNRGKRLPNAAPKLPHDLSAVGTLKNADPTDARSAHYNPLLEVRRCIEEVCDVQSIADVLVDSTVPSYASQRRLYPRDPKRPLTQKQIWAVRFFLDREGRLRDRALFDLAIDSKLRGRDLVKIEIGGLVSGAEIRTRRSSSE